MKSQEDQPVELLLISEDMIGRVITDPDILNGIIMVNETWFYLFAP
jgi:hypothetical protein